MNTLTTTLLLQHLVTLLQFLDPRFHFGLFFVYQIYIVAHLCLKLLFELDNHFLIILLQSLYNLLGVRSTFLVEKLLLKIGDLLLIRFDLRLSNKAVHVQCA